MKFKEDSLFRVISCNINGFAKTNITTMDQSKNKMFRDLVCHTQTDLLLTQEDNAFWPRMHSENLPKERCKGWRRDTRVASAFNTNTHEANGTHLQGGTSTYAYDEISNRSQTINGADPALLGRWSWIQINGQGGLVTRIYSAYRPCRGYGDKTVYAQQVRALLDKGDTRCPQDAFWEDLQSDIQSARDEGAQIILGGDFNCDLRAPSVTTYMTNLGLYNAVFDLHGNDGPNTFARGSTPIDGIFISSTFQIVHAGYLPLICAIGDHRPIWIDIQLSSIVGDAHNGILPRNARRLRLDDTRCKQKYTRKLIHIIKAERLHVLAENQFTVGSQDPSSICEYSIHRLFQQTLTAMRTAEKECRKFKAGNMDWSPKYAKARAAVRYWALCLKERQGKNINKRSRDMLRQMLPPEFRIDPRTKTEAQLRRVVTAARKYLRQTNKTSSELRDTFLHQECAAAAIEKGTTAEAQYKKRINSENQRKINRIITAAMPSKRSAATSKIEVPDDWDNDSSPTTLYTAPFDVEKWASYHINTNFRQVYNTPPGSASFRREFGLLADTEAANEVLEGTYVAPDDIDNHVAMMLDHLKRPEAVDNFTPWVSQAEVQGACRSLREKTSSSPQGGHFGHFIAMGENGFLSEYLSWLLSLPLMAGISPPQYRNITACFLQKKPHEFRINKMRTIWLQDSFFSITQRILARRTYSQAERHGLLAPEDYGGRKGKSALMQAINVRITMDLVLQAKKNAIIRGIDYSNCFDRMAHSMTILKLRQVGHDIRPLICRFATVQNLQVTIRTAFRDAQLQGTNDIYVVPLHEPFQGSLQGGADSMVNWTVVSSHIIDMMRRRGHGVAFRCCISGETTRYIGCHFVDDATQIDCPEDLVADDIPGLVLVAQHALNDLEGFAKGTGQCINTIKSYWWMLQFEWNGGVAKLSKIKDSDPPLTTKDKHGTLQTLRRVEVDDAQEILGTWVAPQDNGKQQQQALLNKITKWVDGIKKSQMTADQAWIALTTRILKGVEWPVAASLLSERQCKQIMSPLLKAGLRESRIQWRIHRDILYSSSRSMGLQFPCLYTTMGIQKAKYLVDNACKDHLSGQLVRQTHERLTLEMGLPGEILNWDFTTWGKYCATRTWITTLWQQLSGMGITITSSAAKLAPRRESDEYLMLLFFTYGFRKRQLKALNRCRLFLHAITVTDIATMCGKYIRAECCEGHSDYTLTNESLSWPTQHRPSQSDWHIWKDALETLTTPHAPTKLRQPLGKWLSSKAEWRWYLHRETCRLYEFHEGVWKFYVHHGRGDRPHAGYFSTPTVTDDWPDDEDLDRAHIRYSQNRWFCLGWADAVLQDDTPPPPTSFQDHIDRLGPTEKYLLAGLTFSEATIIGLGQHIRQGRVRVVSDGSFFETTKTAAFCTRIESDDRSLQIATTQYVPGDPEYMDPYRAECTGILTGFILISLICEYCDIDDGSAKVGCDGSSALDMAFQPYWDARTTDSHFDMVYLLNQWFRKIPIQLRKHWIRGHQDKITPFRRLDRMTQMNILCDRAAHTLGNTAPIPPIPSAVVSDMWTLHAGGKSLTHDIDSQIRRWVHDPHLREYWKLNGQITDESEALIDWDAIALASKGARKRQTIVMTKLLSNNAPTNDNMVKWGFRTCSKCPRCNEDVETADHVAACQAPPAIETWDKSLSSLNTWLIRQQTDPVLRQQIILALKNWKRGGDMAPQQYTRFVPLWDDQQTIGWDRFMNGFLSKRWLSTQQIYYDRIKSKRSGRRWVTSLIQRIWEISWDQWRHRNETLHGGDKLAEYHDPDTLEEYIRTAFSAGAPRPCPPKYRRWFTYTHVDQLLSKSALDQRLWLRSVALIRQKMTSVENETQQMRRNLAAWLRPPSHRH